MHLIGRSKGGEGLQKADYVTRVNSTTMKTHDENRGQQFPCPRYVESCRHYATVDVIPTDRPACHLLCADRLGHKEVRHTNDSINDMPRLTNHYSERIVCSGLYSPRTAQEAPLCRCTCSRDLLPCSTTDGMQVGINLTDPIFQGIYNGKQAHESDFDNVLQRAVDVGCEKFMVTGSSLEESRRAVKLSEQHREQHPQLRATRNHSHTVVLPAGLCYATVGVHPCSSKEFDAYPAGPTALLQELEQLALSNKQRGLAVAFGEIGLDYDRLFLSPKETQLKYFEQQLEAAVRVQLPLFLHSRAASDDFERLLGPRLPHLPKKGLVHSFTGTLEEMQRMLDLGLHIGVNGCSMKTEENVAVVKAIPLDRFQIETDGPWVSRSLCVVGVSLRIAAHSDLVVRDAPFTRISCILGRCTGTAQSSQEGEV